MRGSLDAMKSIEEAMVASSGISKDAECVFFEVKRMDESVLVSCCACFDSEDAYRVTSADWDALTGDVHVILRTDKKRPAVSTSDKEEVFKRNEERALKERMRTASRVARDEVKRRRHQEEE
jgi:hypothetical protein